MNTVFLKGRICSKIEFKFIIKSKKNSIVMFKIKLENGSVIKVKAYDEIADYCYGKLKNEDIIFIQGCLNTKMEIIILEINNMNNSINL